MKAEVSMKQFAEFYKNNSEYAKWCQTANKRDIHTFRALGHTPLGLNSPVKINVIAGMLAAPIIIAENQMTPETFLDHYLPFIGTPNDQWSEMLEIMGERVGVELSDFYAWLYLGWIPQIASVTYDQDTHFLEMLFNNETAAMLVPNLDYVETADQIDEVCGQSLHERILTLIASFAVGGNDRLDEICSMIEDEVGEAHAIGTEQLRSRLKKKLFEAASSEADTDNSKEPASDDIPDDTSASKSNAAWAEAVRNESASASDDDKAEQIRKILDSAGVPEHKRDIIGQCLMNMLDAE